jgi:hypothetical protein
MGFDVLQFSIRKNPSAEQTSLGQMAKHLLNSALK